jgi:hypothetical protein
MIHAFPGLNVNLLLCLSLSLFLITLPNRDSRVRLVFVAVAVFFNVTYVSWRLHATLEPFHFSFVSLWQWIFFLAELCSVVLLSWHLIVLSPGPRSPE